VALNAVSVIDTAKPSAPVGSIDVGLHPTAMYVHENARSAGKKSKQSPAGTLFVANTNSDTISVIDTSKDKVVQTIETKPWPSSDVGYAPTSIAMTTDDHLLVTLGRADAVAANPRE
jgi:YVTN family beta-propeller protein